MKQQTELHVEHYAKLNGFVGPVGPTVTEERWEASWPEEPEGQAEAPPQYEEAI